MSRNKDRYLRIQHKDYETLKSECDGAYYGNWIVVMIHRTYDGMWFALWKKPIGMM